MARLLWRVWFEFVIATPVLGPLSLGTGDQRLAHYLLLESTTVQDAWSGEDIELDACG